MKHLDEDNWFFYRFSESLFSKLAWKLFVSLQNLTYFNLLIAINLNLKKEVLFFRFLGYFLESNELNISKFSCSCQFNTIKVGFAQCKSRDLHNVHSAVLCLWFSFTFVYTFLERSLSWSIEWGAWVTVSVFPPLFLSSHPLTPIQMTSIHANSKTSDV